MKNSQILMFISFFFILNGCGGTTSNEVTQQENNEVNNLKNAKLTWDPSFDPQVVGYKVFSGTGSGNYETSIDVENTNSHTLIDLKEGLEYFFSVKAYDSSGRESAFSNEVSKEIPFSG